MYTYFLFSLLLLAQAIPGYATDGVKQQATLQGTKNNDAAAPRVADSMAFGALPDLSLVDPIASKRHPISAVLKTPIPSLYQINIGSEIYYLSQNGRYLLEGDLIDLKTRKNLTKARRNTARLALINSIPLSDLIIYPALGAHKYTVTVFSDIDCPYCMVVQEHLDEYQSRGIELRFAAFPQTGVDSPDYRKAVAVWCTEERNEALKRASQGKGVDQRDCQAPIEQQYLIGLKIGIDTTPSFILEDGTLISGFVAPDNLLSILEGEQDASEER